MNKIRSSSNTIVMATRSSVSIFREITSLRCNKSDFIYSWENVFLCVFILTRLVYLWNSFFFSFDFWVSLKSDSAQTEWHGRLREEAVTILSLFLGYNYLQSSFELIFLERLRGDDWWIVYSSQTMKTRIKWKQNILFLLESCYLLVGMGL